MIEIDIVDKKNFKPSTVTIAGTFNTSIDILTLSNFLPVVHIFDSLGNRVKRESGSRQSIAFFGLEKAVISICYKHIKRGMRTGAMNNMVSVDLQVGGKNIHLKISSSSITSVGTCSKEFGERVFSIMLAHIRNLSEIFKYNNNIEDEIKNNTLNWLFNKCVEKGKLIKESSMIEKIKLTLENIDEKLAFSCSKYLNDFDVNDFDKFKSKIEEFIKVDNFYNGEISCGEVTIYNSVYHINPIKQKGFRMPLHKLAPYLVNMGVMVEYHNWTSEGVNICIDIEEEKNGPNHINKEYKHRFTVHETTKIRQCSPTSRDEAYRNYLGIMNLLKMFFREKDIDYKKYIMKDVEENSQITKMIKLFNKTIK